jgi:hypothetical protein
MIIPGDKTPVRDLILVADCPKCGVPGLHKMPCRVLICKVDEGVVYSARERYLEVRRYHSRSYGGGYDYRESGSHQRAWLEDARAEYQAALRSAEQYTYLLLRECYTCDHPWFELIRMFRSDAEAVALRERYSEGLVVYGSR